MQPSRLGRYELLRHVATGGMARLYLARVTGPGGFERHVIIKTIRRIGSTMTGSSACFSTRRDSSRLCTISISRRCSKSGRATTAGTFSPWSTCTARPCAAWHYIDSRAATLSSAFTDEQFAFNGKFLNGTAEQKPLATRCAELTDAYLGEALGQKYVERYFPPAAKARMKTLVDNLLAAMKDTIEHLDWMTAETKKKALEKVATFNTKIGYPDKWKDYSSIPIKRDAFFENVAAASAWAVEDDRKTIGKPVDRGRWGMTPPTSDAYYNPSLNEIVFPAGILQPPAFRMDAVDAINTARSAS